MCANHTVSECKNYDPAFEMQFGCPRLLVVTAFPAVLALLINGTGTAAGPAMSFRPRVAVAFPIVAECAQIADWVASEGFEPTKLSNQSRAIDELKTRNFDLMVVDATLAEVAFSAARARTPQPPVIVVGEINATIESRVAARGDVYLTRPLDRMLFVCTISMAIMESRPTRRSERKPARLSVVAHGVPSQIVDVSKEGMRLAIPRSLKAAPPPPFFDVDVPMLGVALNVRRLWIANPPVSLGETVWYGGQLSNNSKRVELAWSTLVDALPVSRVQLEVR